MQRYPNGILLITPLYYFYHPKPGFGSTAFQIVTSHEALGYMAIGLKQAPYY